MKKNRTVIGFGVTALSLILALSTEGESASAEEINTEIEKYNVETYEVKNDEYELITWKDSNNQEYYTISSDVKDKIAVTEHANKIIDEKQEHDFQTRGAKDNWSKSLTGYDRDGTIHFTFAGFNESAIFHPITTNRIVINDGSLTSKYLGANNPDKSILYYSYEFNGTTVSISYPPSLSMTKDKVSWKSSAVQNEWYVNSKTLGAEGHSRTLLTSAEVIAGSDIYKGSYIYRPNVKDTINYPIEY